MILGFYIFSRQPFLLLTCIAISLEANESESFGKGGNVCYLFIGNVPPPYIPPLDHYIHRFNDLFNHSSTDY